MLASAACNHEGGSGLAAHEQARSKKKKGALVMLTEAEIKQKLRSIEASRGQRSSTTQQHNSSRSGSQSRIIAGVDGVGGGSDSTSLTRQSTAERKVADDARLVGALRRTKAKLQASEDKLSAAQQQLKHAHTLNKHELERERRKGEKLRSGQAAALRATRQQAEDLRRVEEKLEGQWERAEAERKRHEVLIDLCLWASEHQIQCCSDTQTVPNSTNLLLLAQMMSTAPAAAPALASCAA